MMEFFKAKEVFDHLSIDDMQRYYTKCVFPIRKCSNGEVSFVHIDRMDERKALCMFPHTAATIEVKDYEWPMGFNYAGWLNHTSGKFAFYVARHARRQWRKGLTKANTNVIIRHQDMLEEYIVNYREIAAVRQDINALMKPLQDLYDKGVKGYYPAYTDAYNKLLAGEAGSVAVAPEFAIGFDELAAQPYLFRRHIIVGRAFADHVLLDEDHVALWPQINFIEARGV